MSKADHEHFLKVHSKRMDMFKSKLEKFKVYYEII